MSKINVCRTGMAMPANTEVLRSFLFGCLDGFSQDDKRAWRKLWKKLKGLEPGEMMQLETTFPRSGPFHRFHMRLEQALFDAQERITDFEAFRTYLKIGAGWVKWIAGPKGGVIPVPKSISYSKADEEEFRQYHDKVLAFIRSAHFSRYLWPHLSEQDQMEMIEKLLEGIE